MKVKWLTLWMFAVVVLMVPLEHVIANTGDKGEIEYTKNQLTPTLEQGATKNPDPNDPNNPNSNGNGGGEKEDGKEEDDRPWWEKAADVVVDKVKKGTETIVDAVTDAGEYISDKTSEIVDATTEWWNERSLLEKSLIIVGVIATVVTLGAAAGVISAGAALTMGVMGAANYALYAATTDNVSFWGGLMWGGLGMVGGGIGLVAKGAKFLAPARAAINSTKVAVAGRLASFVPAAIKGSRYYPMIAGAARAIIPGMMKGAVAGSGLAVYTHMAKWAITGETPDWSEVGRDAMIWGASGAVAGGMFRPVANAASRFVSKGKAMIAGASTSAGSESVVSDWLEGKGIDLKKAAIAASAVVVLGGAGVLATQMTNKSVNQVANTTELASDTAKVTKADDGVQAGKATTAPETDLNSNDPYHLLKQNGIPQTFSDSEIAALKAADMRMELQVPKVESSDRVNTWNEFQSAHKGTFASRTEASQEYKKLVEEQSPWPIGYTPEEGSLKPGTVFEMAMSPGQSENRPGGFGTFDNITDVNYVRNQLAVKQGWKAEIEKVIRYEVIKELPVNLGPVGPQIDTVSKKYLPGGGSQLEMLVPPVERMDYLRVIDERKIRHKANTWNEFQSAHKGTFASRTEASQEYKKLVEEQSPWPIGYTPEIGSLKPGTVFEMALSPGQSENRPGGFGTFDNITDVNYVRNQLAVKQGWKAEIEKVIRYEVIKDLPVNLGPVGPQIDTASKKYLPGGGSQLEMLVPPVERMDYLRVIDERKIR